MLAGQQKKNLIFLVLVFFLILAVPAEAQAYIGPGAGFAVADPQRAAAPTAGRATPAKTRRILIR